MTTPVTRPLETDPHRHLPSPAAPRFTVLSIEGNGDDPGYVIFDCRTGRISHGVYCDLGVALDVAAFNEERSAPAEDGAPPAGTGLEEHAP